MEAVTQPDAAPLPEGLVDSLVELVATETDAAEPVGIDFLDKHSNDLAAIRYSDGHTLMVKRGRYPWAAARFETSRMASDLVRRQAGVVAPAPIGLPNDLDEHPIEAYWRIDLPTLQEIWPDIPEADRPRVLRSWGELVRCIHRIRLPGYGPLPAAQREPSLEQFLETDLAERLRPAVAGTWPGGLAAVDRLIETAPEIADRMHDRPGRLVHNDLHSGNVLCEIEEGAIRCVGLLDLETAQIGPAEMDLANMEVLHGPLFARPLDGPWLEQVREGYDATLDPYALAFFRAYHLVNMGFYSALIGHHEHAAQVARAARRETAQLHRSLFDA
jgi:aminoglycoside phosphotransferase (APT) family kinase protein